MPTKKVTSQARYIFSVAKLLRQHVFTSLSRMEEEGCANSELSLAQLNLILEVRSREEVTLTELAEILCVSPPSVSVMVERLVEKGVLLRDRAREDRRKVIIRVSPDAEHNIVAREERVVATFVDLLEELGTETARKWHDVLQNVEKVLMQRQKEQRMKEK